MITLKNLFLSTLLMWSISSFGQNVQIDSLKNELRNATDTIRVNLLEDLSFRLWDYDVAEAYKYALEGLRLSESLDYTKGLAWSNTHIGLYYYFIGQFDQALLFYRKTIDLLGDQVYDAYPSYTWSRIANLYRIQSKFDSAITFYRVALSTNPEGKIRSTTASVYFNLGICYLEMEKFDSAKYYLSHSLELREIMNDSIFIHSSLKELGHLYLKSGDLDSADYYLKLSKKLGDRLDLAEIKIFYAIYNGELEFMRGNYFEAIESIKSSLSLLNDYDFRQLRVKSLFLLGNIYSEIGEYDGAIENLLKAESINAPLSNIKQEAEINAELGYVYYSQKNYSKAMEKALKSNQLYRSIKLERLEATTYNLLGLIEHAQHNYDSALIYFEIAHEAYEQLKYQKGIATILYNESFIFLEKGDTSKALDAQIQSLAIEESIGNAIGMIISNNSLGNLYLSLKRYSQSEKYLLKARKMLNDHPSLSSLEQNNKFLAQLYYAKGNFKKAYEYLEENRLNSDSLFSQNSLNKTLQLSAIHDLEKKELEIQNLNRERLTKNMELQLQESQLRQQRIFIILGGLALLFFAILSYILIRINKQLRSTQQELIKAEKRASLGILISGLSHEINNPLNFIKGGIEALNLSQKKWSGDQQKMIAAVEEGVARSTKILQTLNSLEHIDKEHFKQHSLNEIVKISADELEIAKHSSITYSLIENAACIISGDYNELVRLFKELLKNAMQSVGKKGAIEIFIHAIKTQCVVEIKDNGSGIDNANLASLESPFYTTKGPDKGKGLGLYLVDYILHEHNGTITFHSVKNEGTTVTVALPKSD